MRHLRLQAAFRLAPSCRLTLPSLAVVLAAIGVVQADDAVDALRARVYRLAVGGEDEQAIPLARELVAATERAYGPDHLEMAASLDALGDRLQKTLQFDEAERVYRRGLEIRERELGPDDARIAASLFALGSTLGRQERHADAAREYRRALSILGKNLGPHHPDLVPVLVRLRSEYVCLGKNDEARIFYDRELAIRKAAAEELAALRVPVRGDRGAAADRPTSPWSGDGLWNEHNVLGSGCYQQQDLEGALFHFVRAARLRPDLGEVHNNIATTLVAMNKPDDALVEFTEAVRLQPDSVAMRTNLTLALMNAGRFTDAERECRAAIEIAPRSAAPHHSLGLVLFNAGRRQEAITAFRAALKLDPDLADARTSLETALREDPPDRTAAE